MWTPDRESGYSTDGGWNEFQINNSRKNEHTCIDLYFIIQKKKTCLRLTRKKQIYTGFIKL